MSSKKMILASMLFITISACHDSDKKISHSIQQKNVNVSGKVINDYIHNAQIWLDCNQNMQLDTDEPSSYSDQQSEFVLKQVPLKKALTCPLTAFIDENSVDMTTSKSISKPYIMIAPAGKKFISPLSTLTHSLMKNGKSLSEAEIIIQKQLLISLPLDADHIDILANNEAGGLYSEEAKHLHQVVNVVAELSAINYELTELHLLSGEVNHADMVMMSSVLILSAAETIITDLASINYAPSLFEANNSVAQIPALPAYTSSFIQRNKQDLIRSTLSGTFTQIGNVLKVITASGEIIGRKNNAAPANIQRAYDNSDSNRVGVNVLIDIEGTPGYEEHQGRFQSFNVAIKKKGDEAFETTKNVTSLFNNNSLLADQYLTLAGWKKPNNAFIETHNSGFVNVGVPSVRVTVSGKEFSTKGLPIQLIPKIFGNLKGWKGIYNFENDENADGTAYDLSINVESTDTVYALPEGREPIKRAQPSYAKGYSGYIRSLNNANGAVISLTSQYDKIDRRDYKRIISVSFADNNRFSITSNYGVYKPDTISVRLLTSRGDIQLRSAPLSYETVMVGDLKVIYFDIPPEAVRRFPELHQLPTRIFFAEHPNGNVYRVEHIRAGMNEYKSDVLALSDSAMDALVKSVKFN